MITVAPLLILTLFGKGGIIIAGNFVPMVFAVLKDKGIDTQNMSVEEAIEKYNELTGKSGRYSVENGEQERTKKQSNVSVERTAVTETTRGKFADKLIKAKSNVAEIKPQDAWRVTSYTADELKEEHPNAKLFTTPGGSTFAVDKGGDIISVCRNPNDKQYRGKDLIAMAVENGGTKLDSYSGNHDFYLKQGFEPVSWCVFDKQYAPSDWTPIRDKEEPIIFYRYTGKIGTESVEDFTNRIKASKDYDTAMEIRDKSME